MVLAAIFELNNNFSTLILRPQISTFQHSPSISYANTGSDGRESITPTTTKLLREHSGP